MTFTLKAGRLPVSPRAWSAGREARAQRDLVMSNWCGLADEEETEEEEEEKEEEEEN